MLYLCLLYNYHVRVSYSTDCVLALRFLPSTCVHDLCNYCRADVCHYMLPPSTNLFVVEFINPRTFSRHIIFRNLSFKSSTPPYFRIPCFSTIITSIQYLVSKSTWSSIMYVVNLHGKVTKSKRF